MGCPTLTIAGGTLEVLGFGLIAYDLYRIQCHEYGTPQIIERIKARVRKLLHISRHHTLHLGDVVGVSDAAGRIKVRTGSGGGIDERLDALEKNFGRLDEEVDQDRVALEASLTKIRGEIAETRADVEKKQQETEQKRKNFQRTSITLQGCGTLLFVGGTVLSVLGSIY